MSLTVIELNDRAIKVGNDSGLIFSSPGFALASGKELVLGEEAERQARMHPTSSYNKYWHDLSMEPLNHANSVRHYADIAYAHLQHLADSAGISDEVVYAVPGNFTRQQLAILLGLTRQTPFEAVGVVDSALAAVAEQVESANVIYADLQLHQTLLSRLSVRDAKLHVDNAVQVPALGSQNLMNMLMNLVTEQFIQQCRFNPQHNAESEQQLYNQLPVWLAQSEADNASLILELKTATAVHTAKLPREDILELLRPQYQKLQQQIQSVATDEDVQLFVSPSLMMLPGLSVALASLQPQVVAEDAIHRTCISRLTEIRSAAGSIHLVNSLAHAASPVSATGKSAAPTHVLYGNRAVRLGDISLLPASLVNGSRKTGALYIDSEAPDELGRIFREGGQVYIEPRQQDFLLNECPKQGRQPLQLGDRIQFDADADPIQLIQVSDGQ